MYREHATEYNVWGGFINQIASYLRATTILTTNQEVEYR